MSARQGPDDTRTLAWLCGLALLLGLFRRLFVGWDAPLWLDEVFTGVLATQPRFDGLVRDILHELGGPVYYLLIWAWEKVAGSSNFALRLPSLIFSLATPLLILWRGHEDRWTRLLWAVIVALWLPGLDQANEARAYTLVFLLGTAQVIAFVALLRAPSTGRAFAWSTVSALLILTHYHGIVVSGLQGLTFLAVGRGRAFRTWPAVLPFVLAAIWMTFHIPMHLRFLDPAVAWQSVLTIRDINWLPGLLLGGGRLAILLAFLLTVTTAIDLYRTVKGAPFPYPLAEALALGASLLGFALVYGMGFLRPTFTARYIFPFVPGLLFGMALWARHWSAKSRYVPQAALFLLLLTYMLDTVPHIADPTRDRRWQFSWEASTPFLREKDAERLLFFWDAPTTAIAETSMMARVGGFFLRRAGDPMPVSGLILAGRTDRPDPNQALPAQTPNVGDAFIWAYDRRVPGTLGAVRPPRPEAFSSYDCRNLGVPGKNVMVLTCVRMR